MNNNLVFNQKVGEIIADKNTKIDLQKKINHLKQKLKSEKQFNRKMEINVEINKLTKEMEELK